MGVIWGPLWRQSCETLCVVQHHSNRAKHSWRSVTSSKVAYFWIKYVGLLVKLHGEESSQFFQFLFRHYQLLQYILIAFVLGKFCRNISKARIFFFLVFS